jgi:hypothetical protein
LKKNWPFYTKDNEVNDCPNYQTAWRNWRKYFLLYDRKHWKGHNLPIKRQSKRQENVAILIDGVLFIVVHMQGGTDKPPSISTMKEQHKDNVDWTIRNLNLYKDKMRAVVIFGHAFPAKGRYKPSGDMDFFNPINRELKALNIPRNRAIYICGDSHRDKPFEVGSLNGRVIARKSLYRVIVDPQGNINLVR